MVTARRGTIARTACPVVTNRVPRSNTPGRGNTVVLFTSTDTNKESPSVTLHTSLALTLSVVEQGMCSQAMGWPPAPPSPSSRRQTQLRQSPLPLAPRSFQQSQKLSPHCVGCACGAGLPPRNLRLRQSLPRLVGMAKADGECFIMSVVVKCPYLPPPRPLSLSQSQHRQTVSPPALALIACEHQCSYTCRLPLCEDLAVSTMSLHMIRT